MDWGNCGTDSGGRPIGYMFEATCDQPGCDKQIDRGLGCACGGWHGDQSSDGRWCCEKYFCDEHLYGDFCSPCLKKLTERIKCPECSEVLDREAILEVDDYFGECSHCGYECTEEVWDAAEKIVDPKPSDS